MEDQKPSYAVDLNVGVNEYIFGRTTPNNKFVVSTGLVNKPFGVEMTGAGKTKQKKDSKTKQKKDSKTKKDSKSVVSRTEVFLKKIEKYSTKSNPNLNNAIKLLKSKKSKDKIKKTK
jgi:uncharacterized Rmd1/YagE family protein